MLKPRRMAETRWGRDDQTTAIPFDMFDHAFVDQEAHRARLLENIYHLAQSRAWDGKAVLAELIAKHGKPSMPDAHRDALAKVFALVMWGELGAWKISAQLADRLVPLEPKMAAASQVTDEARHFYVMHDYLAALGAPAQKIDFWSHRVIRLTLGTSNLAQKILGMQLTIESIALTIFQKVREREVEPVLSELLLYFERDEARHVGLGAQVLPELIREMGFVGRLRLAFFHLQLLLCSLLSLKSMEKDLLLIGIEPRGVLAVAMMKQTEAMKAMRTHFPNWPEQAPLGQLFTAMSDFMFPPEGPDAAIPRRVRFRRGREIGRAAIRSLAEIRARSKVKS